MLNAITFVLAFLFIVSLLTNVLKILIRHHHLILINNDNAKYCSRQKESNNYRVLFFAISFLLSISAVFFVFEWESPVELISTKRGPLEIFEEPVFIPVTKHELPPKPKVSQNIKKGRVLSTRISEMDNLLEKPDENVVFVESDYIKNAIDPIPEEKVEISFGKIFDLNQLSDYPSPVDGMESFMSFIARTYKFPSDALRMGISGKIFVQFVIDEKGEFSDIKILKGLTKSTDEELIRVLKLATPWLPGKQYGRPVKVRFQMPVTLKF